MATTATNAAKKTGLHQILAVIKSIKAEAKSTKEQGYHKLQKPVLFEGEVRKYHPLKDDGQRLPDQTKPVQETVYRILGNIRSAMSNDLNYSIQRDRTNQQAKASVIVDGQTIISDAPVSFLIAFEKDLIELKTIASSIPTLDSAERWNDERQSIGHFRADERQTHRTEKVQSFPIVVQPTDKHPAQVRDITEDKIVGHWHTTKFSGAIQPNEKEKIIARINTLLTAVKMAREEANAIEVVPQENVANKIFDFILADVGVK